MGDGEYSRARANTGGGWISVGGILWVGVLGLRGDEEYWSGWGEMFLRLWRRRGRR